MADRRPESEAPQAKRPRVGEMDPASNPYLAHMYENGDDSYGNGYGARNGDRNGTSSRSGLSNFQRHQTTAAQAHEAEDGPSNPFNNSPLSNQYFNILKTRRDLPVHKQR